VFNSRIPSVREWREAFSLRSTREPLESIVWNLNLVTNVGKRHGEVSLHTSIKIRRCNIATNLHTGKVFRHTNLATQTGSAPATRRPSTVPVMTSVRGFKFLSLTLECRRTWGSRPRPDRACLLLHRALAEGYRIRLVQKLNDTSNKPARRHKHPPVQHC
jgi:hypothetical protein